MKLQSGNKVVQIVGCIIALIVLYYAVVYKNVVLGIIALAMFFYDGYLVVYEPQCVCNYSSV
jgi:hypothetical protein